MMLIKMRKSQNVLVYALLIGVIAVTLIIMSGYIRRRIQGVYQMAGDAIGDGEQLN